MCRNRRSRSVIHTVPADPRNSVTASVAAKGMSAYARAGESAMATTPATVTSTAAAASTATGVTAPASAPAATTARGGAGGRHSRR